MSARGAASSNMSSLNYYNSRPCLRLLPPFITGASPLRSPVSCSRCSKEVTRPRLSPREDPRRTPSPPRRKSRLKSGGWRRRRRRGWRGGRRKRRRFARERRRSSSRRISARKPTVRPRRWRGPSGSSPCSQRHARPAKRERKNSQRLKPTWKQIVPQDHCKKPVWCLEPFALRVWLETYWWHPNVT